jgi:DNA modification methylase
LEGSGVKDSQVVWPGKFDSNGRLTIPQRWNLPFQVIETINETRATRESKSNGVQQSLFNFWAGTEGRKDTEWKNKLIWGDNRYVMSSLLSRFAGKIDLIYIDPPFNTGADFSYNVVVGDSEVTKEPSAIELRAYRDTWGKGVSTYLPMMYERLTIMKDMLSPKGSIFVHLDANVAHYVKVMMDEIFGREHFVNEIIWHYRTFQGQTHSYFAQKHDNILLYSKGDAITYHEQFDTEFEDTIDSSRWADYLTDKHQIVGFRMPIQDSRFTRYLNKWKRKNKREPGPNDVIFEVKGQPIDSVWDMKGLDPKSKERVGFPTQKPEELLERIILASTNDGDLIADFFSGSGTSLVVAERNKRRWIGCDLSRFAIHITRKRLLDLPDCQPFEILNLGKYERQVWQGLSFAGKTGQAVIYEYLAFILKLYNAQPISGFQSIHGRRAGALIQVGSIDAPVTISQVMGAVDECVSAKQGELHVLGWEWEMGLHDLVESEATKKGVKVLLKQIPQDVMDPQVSRGDIRFFDLAYVKARAIVKRTAVQVELQDFGIPSSDLIPNEIREKIRDWSELIDYWAVDFDFKNDTFLNSWQAYRTQDSPKLEHKSAIHDYEKHGKHQVLVKVVDIFGIDSSKLLEVEV